MSSAPPDRLRGALGLRLALWYAILFATGALVLMAATYALLAYILLQRDRDVVRSALSRYAAAYERGGLRLLERVIGAERTSGRYEPRFVHMAKNVMDQLVQGGTVQRGMLGVTVQGITSDLAKSLGLSQVKGALVSEVRAGSPAEQAGVKRGDVILEINGQAVSDGNALRNQVARLKPGTTANLTLLRGGQERRLSVQLGELPRTAQDGSSAPARSGMEGGLGLSVAPGDSGVTVTRVDPSGPAAEAGLQKGSRFPPARPDASAGGPSSGGFGPPLFPECAALRSA